MSDFLLGVFSCAALYVVVVATFIAWLWATTKAWEGEDEQQEALVKRYTWTYPEKGNEE